MLINIDGLAGSGKTWFQTRLLYQDWLADQNVWANYKLIFSKDNKRVGRFSTVAETYYLTHGTLAFDEIQDFAGHWFAMPIAFRQKIAHHRHNYLDIITNCQDFNDLHVEIRRNTHERYRCESILRFPRSDNVKPIFQIIRVTFKKRVVKADNDDIRFQKIGRAKFYFISRWWTRVLYETHADIDFNKFLCKIFYEKKIKEKKGHWIMKIYARDLISRGKARL